MALEVATEQFETEVIEQSCQVPVLVDFWAEWCGPCRMLTPVLEKLEQEYAGRFRLVKVNSDTNREIAQRYRVTGIPAVKLFVDGDIRDEFVGALPEMQVRRFLEDNLPNPLLEKIAALADESPLQAAEALLAEQINSEEAYEIFWNGSLQLLREREYERLSLVKDFLNAIPLHGSRFSDARSTLLQFLSNHSDEESLERLSGLLNNQEPSATMDYYIDRVAGAPVNDREKAKLDLLACFHILGNQGEIVDRYRKKLSAVLF